MKTTKFDFLTADRVYKRLSNHVDVPKYVGQQLTGKVLTNLCRDISQSLTKDKLSVSVDQVQAYLSSDANSTLTVLKMNHYFRFLSVNIWDLYSGHFVQVPRPEADSEEHTCVRILDMGKKDDSLSVYYDFQVAWGRHYGAIFNQGINSLGTRIWWWQKCAGTVSRRNPHATPRDLVQLMLSVKLRRREGQYSFFQVVENDYIRNRNKKLISERRKPCVRGYHISCNSCRIGYVDCFRGTRRLTLEGQEISHVSDSLGDEGARDVTQINVG